MNLEANAKEELDGTATAEVVLKNYKGKLVIWTHNASSLDYAKKALAGYVEGFIKQSLGVYVDMRVFKAVKTYEEIYEDEEAPKVDIQI